MKFKYLFLPILSVILFSCTKEVVKNVTQKESQKEIIRNSLSIAKFNFKSTGSGTYEYGCLFTPTSNGKITELSCLMPEMKTYTVNLYDTVGKKLLATATINQTDTSNGNFQSINPVAVTTGKIYLVSIVSTGKWYYFTPKGKASISYPISSKNINIIGYMWGSTTVGTASKFPLNYDPTYIAGLADFTFLAD